MYAVEQGNDICLLLLSIPIFYFYYCTSNTIKRVCFSCFLLPQVEVEVENMDKAGNFIGWLHIEGVNLSVALVENALSKVHFTAERSAYYKALVSAEDACRQKKEKVGFIISLKSSNDCVQLNMFQ